MEHGLETNNLGKESKMQFKGGRGEVVLLLIYERMKDEQAEMEKGNGDVKGGKIGKIYEQSTFDS